MKLNRSNITERNNYQSFGSISLEHSGCKQRTWLIFFILYCDDYFSAKLRQTFFFFFSFRNTSSPSIVRRPVPLFFSLLSLPYVASNVDCLSQSSSLFSTLLSFFTALLLIRLHPISSSILTLLLHFHSRSHFPKPSDLSYLLFLFLIFCFNIILWLALVLCSSPTTPLVCIFQFFFTTTSQPRNKFTMILLLQLENSILCN